MTNSMLESLKFRLHVRNLLYDYFKRHCTEDYLKFTENLLSEFVEDLYQVPLTDPYSLTIPVDPFDTLHELYSHAQSQSAFPEQDDVPQISQETLNELKGISKARAGTPKTDLIVGVDSYGPPPREETLYPALTRRARRETKKLGQKVVNQPKTLRELLKAQNIGAAAVETIQEPVVDLEDTLHLKMQINLEEFPPVRALLQTTMDILRSEQICPNKFLDPIFLCKQFPSDPRLTYKPAEEVFMPIFSRKHRRGSATTAKPFVNLKSLVENESAPLKSVEVIDPDGDIHRQNLVVVDGWETIRSSPPSTPSSTTSDEVDQLDELHFPSSPNTSPPRIHELYNAKMDEVLIPRSRRIGGIGGITPHILHEKTLNTFLCPLLCRPQPETAEKSVIERASSPTPSSLCGQPPSVLNIDNRIEDVGTRSADPDLDPELQKLYQGYELERNFILDETLDDKQTLLLMDVPSLPQPNDFHKDFVVPKSFSDFVIPMATKKFSTFSPPPRQFLKKVKGCQSLSLELSWVPFTTDKQLPTVLEIVDVVRLFPPEASLTNDYTQMLRVLESEETSAEADSLDVSIRRGLESGPEDLVYKAAFQEEYLVLLNRQERQRLELHDSQMHVMDGDGQPDRQEGKELSDTLDSDDRPSKRLRLDLDIHSDSRDVHIFCPPDGVETNFEENKENSPPFSSPFGTDLDFDQSKTQMVQDTAEAVHADCLAVTTAGKGSGPLSWTSRSRSPQLPVLEALVAPGALTSDSGVYPPYVDHFDDDQPTGLNVLGHQPSLVLQCAEEPELASRSLGITAFAQLRAKKLSNPDSSVPLLVPVPLVPTERPERPRGPPQEICDSNTICLAEVDSVTQSTHKYMASLDFIQKLALVYSLRDCAVELVERQTLGGVDLIIDTATAVTFVNLFSLPARCVACLEKVAQQSWKYSRLLVIFEAYGELCAKNIRTHKSTSTSLTAADDSQPYAYTPPIMKALKKFKRDVKIAEACGTKRASTIIQYAYADTVKEAALFTRMFGDWAEADDVTQGVLWGERNWLDADYSEEEEENLASLKGLNHFSASIILCQVTLQDFVDLLPEERLSAFGCYINPEDIVASSDDLEARFAALQAVHLSSGTLSDLDMGHSDSFRL